MPSPFPGMDPYLEQYWGDVHTRLVTYASDQLQPQLPKGLRARVQEQVILYSEDEPIRRMNPDVRVIEHNVLNGGEVAVAEQVATEPLIIDFDPQETVSRSVEIIDTASGERVVTAIEFLSPANKSSTRERELYLRKQKDLIDGGVNLVEIDLVRAGAYILAAPEHLVPAAYRMPYRICVMRASRPKSVEMYRASFREPLPTIKIPLRASDRDVVLNLQQLVYECYEKGGYHSINYHIDPVPALTPQDADWANELLASKGRR